MKMPILSAISKFTLGVVMLTGVATSVHAQAKYASTIEKNAEVKYIGNVEDAVVFSVSYNNPTNNKFVVTVLDEDGTKLFQSAYSDKKFDKRFKLPKTDKSKLTFEIRNNREIELRQTFEINTRIVEDVVVTKI
jgi:hypothetical protein